MEIKETIGELLRTSKELLKIIELDIEQAGDEREIKKYNEVIGFCEQVVRIIETYPQDKEIVFLDCSCGKSYLSFALNIILKKQFAVNTYFYGVDTNRILIEKCDRIRNSLGFRNMHFINGRIIDVQPEKPVDIVIALHACDIATDEAIAKGYHVKLTEITSPKFTPKNLMIIARRKKGNKRYNLDKYKKLNEMFNTEFVLNNYFNEFELSQNDFLSPVN